MNSMIPDDAVHPNPDYPFAELIRYLGYKGWLRVYNLDINEREQSDEVVILDNRDVFHHLRNTKDCDISSQCV